MVAEGLTYLGKPYTHDMVTGIDCSGLAKKALAAVGVDALRSAAQQWGDFLLRGEEIADPASLKPGDLVFYTDIGCEDEPLCSTQNEVHHVAIYIGGGQLLEAVGYDTMTTLIRPFHSHPGSFVTLMSRVLGE